MARQKAERPLEKVTIRLYLGDKDRIDAYFPKAGHNVFIRNLIHRKLRQLDERVSEKLSAEESEEKEPQDT